MIAYKYIKTGSDLDIRKTNKTISYAVPIIMAIKLDRNNTILYRLFTSINFELW